MRHLVTQMHYRLLEGDGEAYYELGVSDNGNPTGISDGDLKSSISTVSAMAECLNAAIQV